MRLKAPRALSTLEILFFAAAFFLGAIGWAIALFGVGNDAVMGTVYRIIYIHVPCAWNAFLWAGVGALKATQSLVGKHPAKREKETQAAMEISTLFAFLALATGSIWGRPTWGVWWDWDPRLTTTLIMFLTTCAYSLLRQLSPHPVSRRQSSAIVAILSAANVPIVYFSVNLWRSLHQPQTFAPGAKNASSDIALTLWYNVFAMVMIAWSLYRLRTIAIRTHAQLSNARAGQPTPWQMNSLPHPPPPKDTAIPQRTSM